MKIKLDNLTLTNFRNITDSFNFLDGQNIFSGPNGSGKTTLYDAVKWLFEGKDSTGRADFDIKTIIDGAPISKASHSVQAVYMVNESQHVIARVYTEKWSKPRGASEKVRDGHKTTYFIDGIELSKTKYQKAVIDIFGEYFQLVSDVEYMANMHWKDRRELLMPFASKVNPNNIIDNIDGLRDLMGERTIEDAKTAAEQRKKNIAKDLETIPIIIAENQSKLDSAGGMTLERAEKAVEDAQIAIHNAQAKIDSFESGDKSKDIEQLKKLNDELFKVQQEFESKKQVAADAEYQRQKDIMNINQELKNLNEDLQDHEEAIQASREEWKKICERTPDDGHPCIHYGESCPYHGQPVPDEIREKALKDFNFNISEAKAKNRARGKDLSAEIKRIKGIIDVRQAEKEAFENIDPDPILAEKTTPEIGYLKEQIHSITNNSQPTKEIPPELIQTLEASNARLTKAQETRAAIKAVSDSQSRIDELNQQKAQLSAESDKIYKFLSLYDTFTAAMANATEQPINSMFEIVSFQMFETLENGNIVPCCKIMDKQGRSYDGALSNGEKIQAGLDMVRTMQAKLDIQAPVWIDNSESVTGSIDLDCQYVELKATTDFETLTKEI